MTGLSDNVGPLTQRVLFLDAPLHEQLMIGAIVVLPLALLLISVVFRWRVEGSKLFCEFAGSMRYIAPMVGVLLACGVGLAVLLGVANTGTPSFDVVAPSIAKAVMIVSLGVLGGLMAALAHLNIRAASEPRSTDEDAPRS